MDSIAQAISEATGEVFAVENIEPISGGCINEAIKISDSSRTFFVKLNWADQLDMFQAEEAGLREMADAGAVRVPQSICSGTANRKAFLVLEYIGLSSMNGKAEERLGCKLAEMHRTTSEHFGWWRNNTIGATPQINDPMETWPRFFAEKRLAFQCQLAEKRGLQLSGWQELCDRLEGFFGDEKIEASLLHGDLWGGNASMDEQGNPVIYDPATYYGHRETDLAFTEMFGGFGSKFYATYEEAWPVSQGYSQRKELYNFYHVLNHYNLFGGSYGSQAVQILARL
ncbi:MAG: fructosamine kinase family protein [Verrucomicrobiota bacterium]